MRPYRSPLGCLVEYKAFAVRDGAIAIHYQAKRGEKYFGVVLGKVEKGHRNPTALDGAKILATIGWLKFDDVKDALGAKACKKVLDYINKKYSDKKEPE